MGFQVITLLWLMLCISLGSGCSYMATQTVTHAQKPSSQQVDQAIELSTSYLLNAIEPSGAFVYRVNYSICYHPKKRYNMLRHAGTIYALTQAYQRQPDDNVGRALVAASQFLTSCCMAPVTSNNDMLGIWSLPQITHSKKSARIKLGGVGLGLAALAGVEKVIPGTTSIENLRKLGEFLIYMQKPDGSFYSYYIPSVGGKSNQKVSVYYPAEAALGLLMLHDLEPSQRYLVAATKALAYLIQHRDVTTSDQWVLIAGEKLLSTKKYPTKLLPRKLLVQYATRVCENILQEQLLYADNPKYIGGYNSEGRTTPTSTRIEALFAALSILGDKDVMLRNSVKSSTEAAMSFLLQAQRTAGKYSGGMPRAVSRRGFDMRFNRRVSEIRIDYVQHALSAMIQYSALNEAE